MGLRQLEAGILKELREVTGNKKIRQKDILEWSTGKVVEGNDNETVVFLPVNQVFVAYATART